MSGCSWLGTVVVGVMLMTGSAVAGSLEALPEVVPDGNADRSSIPAVYKWDLGALVESDEAWETEAADAQARVEGLAALHDGMAAPAGLARYLEAYFAADELVNRITLYANLRRDTAATDQECIARHQRALGMTNDLMKEGPELRRAILSLDDEQLNDAYREVAALVEFRPFIDSLRRRARRVLPAEAERVLSLAGDNLWAQIDLNELPSASEAAFASLMAELPLPTIEDADGQEVQLTLANYGRYRASSDRRVRRDAVAAMFGTLKEFENTLVATLGGQVKFDVFLARARRYDTALDAYLDKDEIEAQVYRNLIATVRRNAPALHRYVELRRQVMGVDEVHLYDLYVPMAAGVESEITYPDAVALITDALAPLGDEYVAQITRAMDPAAGWIDVYPSSDKQSGAFSSAVYGVHPFVKMNYQNRFDDVSTLAHEYGHAMHSFLSMAGQPYLRWRYVPFIAEVASTCNEMLLSRHVIGNASSEAERAWLLTELAESIRTTIYRQTMFAEFELKVHELAEAGEPITAEALNRIYGGLLKDYYGPSYAIDENDDREWAYIPHFYWKYYVFTYATGLSSGIAIAERLAADEDGARDAYLNMLGEGSSRPPLDILRDGGVDLTRPEAIEAALQLFARTIGQLEELLVK